MTIEEAYKEWCGTDRLVNSNKEIHDSTECIEFAEYWHDKLVKTCDLADVVNWLPFNEENASHYNRLAKERKLIQLYDTGEQRHINDDNFPMAVITHYREG